MLELLPAATQSVAVRRTELLALLASCPDVESNDRVIGLPRADFDRVVHGEDLPDNRFIAMALASLPATFNDLFELKDELGVDSSGLEGDARAE